VPVVFVLKSIMKETPFIYSSVQNPEIIRKFSNGEKSFKCPKHGLVSKWTFFKKKRARPRLVYNPKRKKVYFNEYIKCSKCTSEYESKFLRNNPIWYLFHTSKKHAKKKKFTHNLDRKFIEMMFLNQKNQCSYTKIPFGQKYNRPSIDRVNSKIGYEKNNVELVLQDINLMKQDLSKKEFIKLCRIILNPKQNKGSLKLLKYAKRTKTKEELSSDLDDFKKGKKVLCYVHGYHREFITRGSTGRKIKFSCNKCFTKRTTLKRNSYEDITKKVNDFESGKRILCPHHGYHRDFQVRIDNRHKKKRKYTECMKCRKKYDKMHQDYNFFSRAFTKAKSRDVKFDLEYKDIISQYIKQKGKCAISNETLGLGEKKPSIDRIDPKKGYLKKNIQLVTYLMNRTKWDIENKKFYKYVKLVSRIN